MHLHKAFFADKNNKKRTEKLRARQAEFCPFLPLLRLIIEIGFELADQMVGKQAHQHGNGGLFDAV